MCSLVTASLAAGENINRNGACKDTSKSVIVRTTDTCPCSYPNNYYSELCMLLAAGLFPRLKPALKANVITLMSAA
jgi:hypothetical protein